VFRIFLDEPGAELALNEAAIGRWLAVATLAGMIVFEALRPEQDVVRGTYGGDPDAGLLVPAGESAPAGGTVPVGQPDPTTEPAGAPDLVAAADSGVGQRLPRGADSPDGVTGH